MKLVIAGSRDLVEYARVVEAVESSGFSPQDIREVVSGGAKGADSHGERWARVRGIPIRRFLPDWETHGKKAGPLRNAKMAQYADAVVVITPDPPSRGSKSMMECAKMHNRPLYWHRVSQEDLKAWDSK